MSALLENKKNFPLLFPYRHWDYIGAEGVGSLVIVLPFIHYLMGFLTRMHGDMKDEDIGSLTFAVLHFSLDFFCCS